MKKSRGAGRIIPVFLMLMLLSSFTFAAGDKNVINFINEACRALSAGEYEDCAASCNKALAIDPLCAAAYYTRGFADRYKGDYNRSISDFNKAIRIDPRYAAAYYGRAKSYYYKRQYDEAWEDLHKAKVLGCRVEDEFLRELRKASGRKE
jgi:tetratricopeptide (TPR) repeat protein